MKGNTDMIFLSNFENKIDSKGRVSVPAPFRAVLEANKEPLVVTRSLTAACLQGQGHSRITQIINALDRMDVFSEEIAPLQMMIANAAELKMDNEGRIMIPEAFLGHAEITDIIVFAGVGRVFEMWTPDLWQKRVEEQSQRKPPQLILGNRPEQDKDMS
jgi:MraZ protein